MLKSHRMSTAFTLIELLVVVAIIAVLVSILLPALGAAREISRQVKCSANLHQWALGFSMFENDNNGSLPLAYTNVTAGAWFHTNTMGRYLPNQSFTNGNGHNMITGGVAVCPSHPEAVGTTEGRSYSFNYWIQPAAYTGDSVLWKQDQNKNRRLVLSDGCYDQPSWAMYPPYNPMTVSYFVGNAWHLNYFRHGGKGNPEAEPDRYSGKCNILLGDWHVGTFPMLKDPDPNVLIPRRE